MSAPHRTAPDLHDAYVGKLNAALAAGDVHRVADLSAAHARETGHSQETGRAVPGRRPAPAGRVRRALRAFDAHTVRVFNPPAALRGGSGTAR